MEPIRLCVCRLRVCVTVVRRKTWGAVPFTPNRGSAMTTDTKSKVGTEKERGQVGKFLFKNPLPFTQITLSVECETKKNSSRR
jgi:hypothetical protein